MGSQTSSTRRTEHRRGHGGYTLAEVLVAFGISSIILTGVLTTFVMMGRTGALAQNYTELEVEARKALELFSREARMANAVTSYSASRVTFAIPDNSWDRKGTGAGAYSVTYEFNERDRVFTRSGPPAGNPTGTAGITVLVRNVSRIDTTPFIRYFRYVTTGYQTGFTSNFALSATEIKQVELNFIAKRETKTVATATDKVLSARFILRNK